MRFDGRQGSLGVEELTLGVVPLGGTGGWGSVRCFGVPRSSMLENDEDLIDLAVLWEGWAAYICFIYHLICHDVEEL